MKTLIALFLTVVSASVFAAGKEAMDPKKQEMMKAWMEYATPGAPHKALADIVGKWKYTSKFWETPEAKAEESTGTSNFKMILGGRFLQQDVKGKAMGGMPFQGMGIVGYDNIKGKYDTIWIDNMATGVMHGTGMFDANLKTLNDSGEMSCPMTKNKKTSYRSEWKITDKKNMTYTMYGPAMDTGKEFKMMEMVFTRVK